MDYNQKVYWENNSIFQNAILPSQWHWGFGLFHPLLDYRMLFTTWVFTFSAICGIRGGVRSNCLFLCESFLSD